MRITPDGRYFVVRGRLWRMSNPNLPSVKREAFVARLMQARRQIRSANVTGDDALRQRARAQVHKAKVALGERGPPWWKDGSPDYNRHMAHNTPYADWFATLSRPHS